MAACDRRSERSYAPFTDEHLKRLAEIAQDDERGLFKRKPHLEVYRGRLLVVALCQGGGLHYVQCQKGEERRRGVKDLDVYSFYVAHPQVPWPYRRHRVEDFGESEFGYHPEKRKEFVGRHVDLMGRALPVEVDADPVEAVREWLTTNRNETPKRLRIKGVVGLFPVRYRGRIIWDPNVELD